MHRTVFLAIFSLTALIGPLPASSALEFTEQSTKKYSFEYVKRNLIEKKSEDYQISKVVPFFSRYFEGDHLCLDIELPSGLEIPASFQAGKIENSLACYLEAKITNAGAFLDSQGNPLSAFSILIEVMNKDSFAELYITTITTVISNQSGKSTKHQSTTTYFDKLDGLQVDLSVDPELFRYDGTERIGCVEFKILCHDQ